MGLTIFSVGGLVGTTIFSNFLTIDVYFLIQRVKNKIPEECIFNLNLYEIDS
jgi:hypothetical protein